MPKHQLKGAGSGRSLIDVKLRTVQPLIPIVMAGINIGTQHLFDSFAASFYLSNWQWAVGS